MKKNITKWLWMIFIVAIAISVTTSTAFTEGTGSGPKEGIKVHGHWKIVVMNPDGTVDSITEFDNALSVGDDYGAERIVNLMTGQSVHAGWAIALANAGGSGVCDSIGNPGTPTTCIIGESGGSYPYGLHSANLTVADNGVSLTLSGSVVVDYADTITRVQTSHGACASTTTTIDSCKTTGNSYRTFTDTTLVTQPSVVPSQLIQVTVTISFS
jgi:hypothetical protein